MMSRVRFSSESTAALVTSGESTEVRIFNRTAVVKELMDLLELNLRCRVQSTICSPAEEPL